MKIKCRICKELLFEEIEFLEQLKTPQQRDEYYKNTYFRVVTPWVDKVIPHLEENKTTHLTKEFPYDKFGRKEVKVKHKFKDVYYCEGCFEKSIYATI